METVSTLLGVKAPNVFQTKETPETCINPNLIMGVELETENCPLGLEFYRRQMPSKLWYIEEDGSLRPRGAAWEFISKPAAISSLLPELGSFFKATGFNEANYSDRCSVHVHTNVTDFTRDNMACLAVVYTSIEPILFKFVNFYNVKEKQGKYRDTNIYCIPWSQCRINNKIVNQLFSNLSYVPERWQKYTALNLIPMREIGTVEWRHMHGTADMDKLRIWLNMIGAIMDYAKKTPYKEVSKTMKMLNDTSAYQQYFTSVFQDTIPYNEDYRQALSDGVINAKIAMVGSEKVKDSKKDALYTMVMDDIFNPQELTQDNLTARVRELQNQQAQAFHAAREGQINNPIPTPPERPQAPRIQPVAAGLWPAAQDIPNPFVRTEADVVRVRVGNVIRGGR